MIEEGIMNLVLQGGANALFAGFLFYQNRELQRRSDEARLEAILILLNDIKERVFNGNNK